jgi:cytidyltransferase-like protein
MHDIGLIGGTFDRFHLGHYKLIKEALRKCSKIEIWIISDEIAKNKNPMTLSWEDRKAEIINNLDLEQKGNIKFGVLIDDFGPAPTHPNATAIICTEETVGICVKINIMRKDNNLDELEIIRVAHAMAWDNLPISSTRIRDGGIDRSGASWIQIKKNDTGDIIDNSAVLKMTKEVSQELKGPFGELIEGPEENPKIAMQIAIKKYQNDNVPLISVGDVSTLTLENLGFCANIAFIDGKTKREDWPKANEIRFENYDQLIECINPPGELTLSLLNACKKSLNSWIDNRSSSIIRIDGEEDLAPLIIHLLAPLGTVVIYGQPHKGLVVRITKEETKSRCRKIIEKFERIKN